MKDANGNPCMFLITVRDAGGWGDTHSYAATVDDGTRAWSAEEASPRAAVRVACRKRRKQLRHEQRKHQAVTP